MTNFMVAVDSSKDAEDAFFIATGMLKKDDTLFILAVSEAVSSLWSFGTQLLWKQVQDDVDEITAKLLQTFGDKCSQLGIENYHLLRASSSHVGKTICDMVDKKKINHLVIGRRGVTGLQRLFSSSTSKYCVENANAVVTVAKGCEPDEIHDSTRELVQSSEELERQRRIRDEQQLSVQEKEKRATVQSKLAGEIHQHKVETKQHKVELWRVSPTTNELHESSHELVQEAEEKERKRRIREQDKLSEGEKRERDSVKSRLLGEMHQLQDKAKQEGHELEWWNYKPVTGK